MHRRKFLSLLTYSPLTTSFLPAISEGIEITSNQRLFATLHVDGGWDVSSFCDPKTNVAGEAVINNWAKTLEPLSAGNITFAPFAHNEYLFSNYHKQMLVINGIDAETDNHPRGAMHNLSGRRVKGYPTLSALFAAANGADLPLPYLSFGPFSETADLVINSKLSNLEATIDLLNNHTHKWYKNYSFQRRDIQQVIIEAQKSRLNRLRQRSDLTPRQAKAMEALFKARENSEKLIAFSEKLNETISSGKLVPSNTRNIYDNALAQIQLSLLSFSAGTSCSCDLNIPWFDTHSDHDKSHEPRLAKLAEAIDYFWKLADELNISERITLFISSDFSRTPWYNTESGKDHWPIGSNIIMERHPVWGNRVIGKTDELQGQIGLNKETLMPDLEKDAIFLRPAHIHGALRDYLGLSSHPLAQQFPLSDSGVDLFSV